MPLDNNYNQRLDDYAITKFKTTCVKNSKTMSSEMKKIMPRVCRWAKHLILVFCLTIVLVVSPCVADDVSKRGKDCYQRMCWCSHDTADCSRNGGRLQFVPKLPSTISTLDFSFNNLTHLQSDFFSNVTQLSSINLTDNGLYSIDQHAFRGLRNLTNITLDYNDLDFDSVRPVLNVSSLVRLQMCDNYNVTYIPDNIFLKFPLLQLSQLLLAGSNLPVLNLTVFKPLKNLYYLNVANSKITRVVSDTLPSLTYLILRTNSISSDFIPTCAGPNVSYFPMLRYLTLRNNEIYGIDGSVCLPRLTYLNLGSNKFHVLKTESFSKLPQLIFLRLTAMHNLIGTVEPGAFTSSTLENVYLSETSIKFKDESVSDKMFNDCPRLKYVQLDVNDFSDVPDAKFQELFQNNTKLTTVYMGRSKITTITSDTFKGMPNVEELNLYSNLIEDLPDGVFDHLSKLKILRIDHNRLSEIRETTFSVSTRQRLHLLDLSNNPYACTCNVLWFKRWLMDERKTFAEYPKGYACASFSSSRSEQVGKPTVMANSLDASKYSSKSTDFYNQPTNSRSFQKVFYHQHQSPPDITHLDDETSVSESRDQVFLSPVGSAVVYLSDFVMNDQACLLSQSTSLLTAVLAAVLVVFMLTFLVLYKYRWHIRLALYEAFRGNPQRRQQQQQQRQPEREYEYDVFVSYANEDVNWVRQELIPTLEGRYGLRLCIHQRDFPVGGNIIDNISTCVHASKRVLFVLSPHFARSRWCQFELVFCQNYIMERDDVLVLTLLAPISGRDMTDAISAMFKTTTYLAWGEEDDARHAFWGRLVLAFHDIVPRQVA